MPHISLHAHKEQLHSSKYDLMYVYRIAHINHILLDGRRGESVWELFQHLKDSAPNKQVNAQ